MAFGSIPYQIIRQQNQRTMTERVLVIGHFVGEDEFGGEVWGDPYVAHETKGSFRTATATEVANYQRLERRVDGVLYVPVSAGPYLENEDFRIYRADVDKTYEITGVRRQSPAQELSIEIMVREADRERWYRPSE